MALFKKILIILGFFSIVAIIGFFIYNLFLKTTAPLKPITKDEPGISPGLPIAEEGKEPSIETPDDITKKLPIDKREPEIKKRPDSIAKGDLTIIKDFVDRSSQDITLDKNGTDIKYYDREDEKYYKITKDGQKNPLSDKAFHNVSESTWSPTKNKAIIEYPDGANIIYDFDNEKQITMPDHWEDFEFSPTGEDIAMKSIGLDTGNRWLAITNDTGSRTKRIESIGINANKVHSSWSPNNQTIAMYTKGIDFDRQEVFFVGLNKENFKSTVVHGRGLETKWNNEGDKLLYSVYSSLNEYKPMLWSVNAQGDAINTNRRMLNVETWAHKCNFGSNNYEIYCAIPNSLPTAAGLSKELALTTNDTIYKININTGLKKLVAIPEKSYSMSNLIISNDERFLYFKDNATGKIKQLRLK